MQVRVGLTMFGCNWLQYLLTFQLIVTLGGFAWSSYFNRDDTVIVICTFQMVFNLFAFVHCTFLSKKISLNDQHVVPHISRFVFVN